MIYISMIRQYVSVYISICPAGHAIMNKIKTYLEIQSQNLTKIGVIVSPTTNSILFDSLILLW